MFECKCVKWFSVGRQTSPADDLLDQVHRLFGKSRLLSWQRQEQLRPRGGRLSWRLQRPRFVHEEQFWPMFKRFA